ncbi:hypothetical protein CDAR_282871 [Caerostris darwini]|uniref:Uncharacterized protein n=1 Tax=Caerostris darwini TaxID=1538125 RepID=A0AAV4W602_9ARAC|nr:hypothetical protein CDAR_282871 [Caerostris darwini]
MGSGTAMGFSCTTCTPDCAPAMLGRTASESQRRYVPIEARPHSLNGSPRVGVPSLASSSPTENAPTVTECVLIFAHTVTAGKYSGGVTSLLAWNRDQFSS